MATRVKQDGGDDEATVDLISSTLPRDDRWMPLCLSGGFWLLDLWVPAMPAAQRRLVTRPDDVFVASCPKSGTTWLKALVFAVVHRHLHRPSDPHHPLRTASPHDCVPFLEEELITAAAGDLEYYALPSSPRIWSIHSPYSSLPAASVRDSDCRIVYIARDPKDVFTSLFHFKSEVEYSAGTGPLAVDEAFEMFCSGICPYGPIWEHALEYWNESRRRPGKVMFLRYEEMKRDPAGNLRRLAEFLGRPFSSEEEEREREGVAVREILELCSFRSLTGLAVNREGVLEKYKSIAVPRKSFFRVGAVGDWRNCLSEENAARLDRITEEKLQGSGFGSPAPYSLHPPCAMQCYWRALNLRAAREPAPQSLLRFQRIHPN